MENNGMVCCSGVTRDLRFQNLLHKCLDCPEVEEMVVLSGSDDSLCDGLANQNKIVTQITMEALSEEKEVFPLSDSSADSLIINLLEQPGIDWRLILQDAERVVTNRLVVAAYDQYVGQKSWFGEYFGELWKKWYGALPEYGRLIDLLETVFGVQAAPHVFSIAFDSQPPVNEAGWRNPHWYVYPGFRNRMPLFQSAQPGSVGDRLLALEEDLDSGMWEAKYGDILSLHELDVGYRVIVMDLVNGQNLQYRKSA